MATSPARLAPWFAGAVIALPNLLARYPPMADLPLHEAIVGLLRHWSDPTFVPRDVYELNLGPPNQLFYFLILALAYPLGVTWATKVVVAGTLLLFPVACARLADHLGVTRWAAVALTPLGLGWMYFWGLLANMIGLDLYLWALPALDRFCNKPSRRGLGVVCAWAVALHLAHDMIAMTTAGTLCLLTACRWRGAKENLLRLPPVALILALALSSRIAADHIKSGFARGQPPFVWYGLGHKIVSLPGVLYGGYAPAVRNAMFAVCFAPTLMFGYERWKHRRRSPLSWPQRLDDSRFEFLGLALLASYLVAPANMSSTTLIYHRFLPPAWILLSLAAARTSVQPAQPWRLPRLLATIAPVVPLLTAWPKFVQSDRAYRDLDAIIDHIAADSTSLVLELGPTEPNGLSTPVTGIGHVIALRGGRSLFDYTESPSSPVHIRTDRFWNHIYERLDAHAYRFMPPFDFTRFRYAILHTPNAGTAALVALALAPEGRFVTQVGEWTLVESTLPLVPIDAPDELVPIPHPLTLRKRASLLAEKIRTSPPDADAHPGDGEAAPTSGGETTDP